MTRSNIGQMENGYRLWTFYGQLLSENPIDKFKQLLWRPRPPTFLSKEEQRNVRRNLREYSREFDEIDREREENVDREVIENRRALYREWYAWVEREAEDVKEEREELGLPDPEGELELMKTRSAEQQGGEQVVEETVDEVVEETEEIV